MGWGESEYTVVGESKILTVSYGTFSCTLEGFDDPFSTMKAIAEYFRDLAAGDRFFGAEPPQPDTEMLHRIAEQTIQSRVNAEVTDNSLILRQDHSAEHTQPSAAPLAAAAAVDPAPVAQAAAPAPSAPEQVVMEPTAFADSDSIAAKLQRIRAVVSRETAEPAEVTSFYSEDEHAEELASTPAPTVAPTEEYEDEEDQPVADITSDITEDAAPEMEAEPETDVSDEVTSEEPVEDQIEDEVEAEVEAEDVLANAETDEAEDAVAEDTTAEDTSDEEVTAEAASDEIVAENAEPEEAAQDEMAEAETSEDSASDEATLSAIAGLVQDSSETDAPEDVAEDVSDDADTEVSDEEELSSVVKPRRRIIVQKVSRADVEAAHSAEDTDSAEDQSGELDADAEAALMRELAEVEAEIDADTPDTADAVTDIDETDGTDDDIEARALAAAQAAQDTADAEAEAIIQASEAEAAEAKAEADAKAEEEAEALAKVMAEAAEVEAEINGIDHDLTSGASEDTAKDEAAADTDEAEEAKTGEDDDRASRIARRSVLVEDEDAALNRLMDATSTRLSDDDEGAVRRASIAHLKAAVAATKADDSIAKAAADEEERELDQYRSDLARVVRPGRARPRAEGTSTSRPSPLVLVSEQRIDAPAPEAAALDVRPRRITSGNLALQEEMDEDVEDTLLEQPDVESFGEYAARYAALDLPDILEAAAAHYTYVEGTPNFTRPMLMRKISAITVTDPPSREAGLRSFGSLLREGKIVKGDDGKFVISGKSRFTPEAQEAGE